MKRLLLLVGILALAGCGAGTGESCQNGGSCSKGGSWQACCTASSCLYKMSDGTVYNCSGTDCSSGNSSAASQTVTWCSSH